MSFKEKARAYFTAVSAYDAATVEGMLDENYIQHNPFVPTGRAAFLALLPKLKQYGSKIENVRILEDGPYVIMHHKWTNATPFGYDRTAAFHIIRFDSRSLIAEHWNVMMEDQTSGKSLTDGETRIEDLQKTNENKARANELFESLRGFPTVEVSSQLPRFFHDSLLRSPSSHFEFGSPDLVYRKLHKVFGEGNFTLLISEGTRFGVSSALYDLFRFENEKIKEHWRIAQRIPTENLANDNTMFGFR